MPQLLQETSGKLLLIIADAMEKCLQITEDQWLETKLDITCHIGDYPPVPLSFVVIDYVTHLDHHLAQIFNKG